MKHKFLNSFIALVLVAGIGVLLHACKKNDGIVRAPQAVLFTNAGSAGSYSVPDNPATVYKIPVGVTAAPDKDLTINFTITSPSGAVEGQQYTIASKSVTIKAGTTVDTISLKGLFSGFPSGRKDTLVFKITSGGLPVVSGSDSYTVVLQQFCPLVMSDFAGNFEVLVDEWEDYAPGTVIPVTVSGNTVSFYYDTAPDATRQPIVVKIDPNTFVTSVDPVAYGHYSTATILSAKSINAETNVAVPCDIKFTVTLNHTSSLGNYGDYQISLQKQ